MDPVGPPRMLTAAGFLAWITPERLRSLLGQGSRTAGLGLADQALFVGVIFAGMCLLTVILMFGGILSYMAEDFLKRDAGRDPLTY